MKLYKLITFPSDEPVEYVGVYVLRWGRVSEPSVGFIEATPDEILEECDNVCAYIEEFKQLEANDDRQA